MNEEALLNRLPGHLRRIAELVGVENTIKIAKEFGGLHVYIHKLDDFYREIRDHKIREAYDKGAKINDLARKYDLSSRHIYNILGVQPKEQEFLPLFIKPE